MTGALHPAEAKEEEEDSDPDEDDSLVRTKTSRSKREKNPETAAEVKAYYDKQIDTYVKVWGEDGRVSFGYFESPGVSFKDAQTKQTERLADAGGFSSTSVVLDIGCGTAVNCVYLAKRSAGLLCYSYNCRPFSLPIVHADMMQMIMFLFKIKEHNLPPESQ